MAVRSYEKFPRGLKPAALCVFGTGHLVVDTGKHDEKWSIFIAPVAKAGPLGQLADTDRPLDRIVQGEVVLSFPTEEQMNLVYDALMSNCPPVGRGATRG